MANDFLNYYLLPNWDRRVAHTFGTIVCILIVSKCRTKVIFKSQKYLILKNLNKTFWRQSVKIPISNREIYHCIDFSKVHGTNIETQDAAVEGLFVRTLFQNSLNLNYGLHVATSYHVGMYSQNKLAIHNIISY